MGPGDARWSASNTQLREELPVAGRERVRIQAAQGRRTRRAFDCNRFRVQMYVLDVLVFGRSSLRKEVLLYFFSRPAARGHVREIARGVGRAASAVGRELDRLERAGVLRSADSPSANEIRALVQRTIGIEGTLRRALGGLAGIDAAWIFGSYAARTDRPTSDLDVLIVGSPNSDLLRRALGSVERQLRRDVSLVELTRSEFGSLVRKREPFIRDVLSGPLVFLAGKAQYGRRPARAKSTSSRAVPRNP